MPTNASLAYTGWHFSVDFYQRDVFLFLLLPFRQSIHGLSRNAAAYLFEPAGFPV